MTDDLEQLKLLSIFHYVVGGIMFFFSLMPLIYVGIGMFICTIWDGVGRFYDYRIIKQFG